MAERVLQAPPRPDVASGNGAGRAGRTIRRRQALPNGRAVAGGLLVAVAAVGLFAAWRASAAPPTTAYVVAAHPVPVGAVLERGDLTTVRLDLPASLRRRAFTDVRTVVGAEVLGPLERGELVQSGAVTAAEGKGRRQVSFSIEASRALNGALRRGQRVDVVATYGGSGNDSWTAVIADRVLVADVASSGSSLSSARTLTLTLSLEDPDEVLAVTHAARAGTITIVRTGDGDISHTYRPAAPDKASP